MSAGLSIEERTTLPGRLAAAFAATDATLADWVGYDGVTLVMLPGETLGNLDPVTVPDKLPPRPKRCGFRRREGLLWMEEEALNRWAECPGGWYGYVDTLAVALPLLTAWADHHLWAAVDLETGVGIREGVDPVSGRPVPRYVAGSDPFTSPLLLCSVSVEPGIAIVFDMRILYKEPAFKTAFTRFLLEAKLICHNASFEQGFFKAQFGEYANIVFDTMLVHQLLTAGLPAGSDLESVLAKYEGLVLEKRWQKFFIQIHPASPLPNEAISYAAGDVCRLLTAAAQIDAALFATPQYHIWTEVERPFMRWVATAAHTGVAIDAALLGTLLVEAQIERDGHLQVFQGLAEGVLVGSWQQLLAWFKSHGVILKDTADDTLKTLIASVPAGSVVSQGAAAILGYRGAAKIVSTYIEPYLTKLVNPKTGRIHPGWKQASTVTGRMACVQPNFQNIPSEGPYTRIRNALVAPEGMLLAWLDYSQFEVRALADAANEPKMLAVFAEGYQVNRALEAKIAEYALPESLEALTELPQKGTARWTELSGQFPELAELVQRAYECDFHRRTAAILFKKPVNQVTKAERAKSKHVTFGLPYGAGPKGISEKAKIPLEEAKKLVREYEQTFSQVKRFLDRCKAEGKAGQTQTAFGRVRRYRLPSQATLEAELTLLKAEPTAAKKWAEYVTKWESTDPRTMAGTIVKAAGRAVEREATNQPIQGANADATKLATVLAGPALRELGATILLWVHDEIVLQAPAGTIEAAAAVLREAMVAAARRFLTRCPVETSVSIGPCWGK